jgi:uncharacterized SAM-dependent methyltransferase
MRDKLQTSTGSAKIIFDSSQFPEKVRMDLLESLRARQVNHKFHYQSYAQTAKWLALHETHSPARKNAAVASLYSNFLSTISARLTKKLTGARKCGPPISVIGLGCGSGWKDARLIERLRQKHREIRYIPVDVGAPMVLTARKTVASQISQENCFPVVADLATSTGLGRILDEISPRKTSRIITVFGMLPNFEPDEILPALAALVKPGDFLAISANLAPGNDYRAGVERILPQYNNRETRDWLLTFFSDLGFDSQAGDLLFTVEEVGTAPTLLRIEANYVLSVSQRIVVEGEQFLFSKGDKIRAFYSYRHTAPLVRELMENTGLRVIDEMLDSSGEEGLFMVDFPI